MSDCLAFDSMSRELRMATNSVRRYQIHNIFCAQIFELDQLPRQTVQLKLLPRSRKPSGRFGRPVVRSLRLDKQGQIQQTQIVASNEA